MSKILLFPLDIILPATCRDNEMSSYKDTSLLSNEYVSFDFDQHEVKCVPMVMSDADIRPFAVTDMERVADFDNIPTPAPMDAAMNVGDPKDLTVGRVEILEHEQTYGSRHEVVFQMKYVALRGKFLFVFDETAVEWNEIDSKFEYKISVPSMVIPLGMFLLILSYLF